MFVSRLSFGLVLLLASACADGEDRTNYDYPTDPANVTRTGPPDLVMIAPSQPGADAPDEDVAPDDGAELDAVGGAGGFGGSVGLGGSAAMGGVGGSLPLGGASGFDEALDGVGGAGFGGTVGNAGTTGGSF